MPISDTRPEPRRRLHRRASVTSQPVVVAGRFELHEIIGRGGFGTVHRATDLLTGEVAAVKLLRDLNLLDLRRLRREIASLRLLRLPGVVRLIDEGELPQTGSGFERYLVMDYIEGLPFPGDVPRDWRHFGQLAIALLETLGRIHDAGVVHRDLKPANVLVTPTGRPILLDFGLSIGEPVGQSATAQGILVGTPAYLAPEQVMGDRGDARSDLYALGVMFYEALAGRPPHSAPNMPALLQAKVTQVPLPLRTLAPDVPPHVADVIDRMLAAQPHHRPHSAAEAVSALAGKGEHDDSPTTELPWLGTRFPIDWLLASARGRRSADIAGPPGSGRTRVLREAARLLRAEGREVVWLRPGRLPFSSLDALTLPSASVDEMSLQDAVATLGAQLVDLLAHRIVLGDDWERIDRWTAALLEAKREDILVLRALRTPLQPRQTPVPDAIALQPLQLPDLRLLFAGMQRLFHVPEDAAAELHRRTAGRPVAVVRELAMWQRAGLTRQERELFVLTREAIEQLRAGIPADMTGENAAHGLEHMADPGALETSDRVHATRALQQEPQLREMLAWLQVAWPHTQPLALARAMGQPTWQLEALVVELLELGAARRLADGRLEPRWRIQCEDVWTGERVAAAHRAMAATLPPGTERRLFHLVSGGQLEAVGPEAIARARSLVQLGRLGEATVLVQVALRTIRDHEAGMLNPSPLLAELVDLAHAEGTARALELAGYEIQRALETAPEPAIAAELTHLRQLAVAAVAALTRGGDATLAQVEAVPPFLVPELEIVRQALRVRAVRACSLPREEAVLTDILRWAEAAGGQAPLHAAAWLGRLRYRQTRYDEAASLHQQVAAATSLPPHIRLTALTNAATALQSAQRYPESRAVAQAALAEASDLRNVYAAARAEWILRALDYRECATRGADLELVAAVDALAVPYLQAQVVMTEALAAWRAHDRANAEALAERAAAIALRLGMRTTELMCRLIAALVTRRAAPDLVAQALEFARSTSDAEVAVQVVGLAAMVAQAEIRPHPAAAACDPLQAITAREIVAFPFDPAAARVPDAAPAEWRDFALRLVAKIPKERRSSRLDLISPEEALVAVGA